MIKILHNMPKEQSFALAEDCRPEINYMYEASLSLPRAIFSTEVLMVIGNQSCQCVPSTWSLLWARNQAFSFFSPMCSIPFALLRCRTKSHQTDLLHILHLFGTPCLVVNVFLNSTTKTDSKRNTNIYLQLPELFSSKEIPSYSQCHQHDPVPCLGQT